MKDEPAPLINLPRLGQTGMWRGLSVKSMTARSAAKTPCWHSIRWLSLSLDTFLIVPAESEAREGIPL